jgi:hypothetical protein
MSDENWLPELPPTPMSGVQIKRFMVTINQKGIATRSDLLPIAGSSTELDSWLRDLIDRLGFVEEIVENGRRLYRKTPRGRTHEQVLTTFWPFVKVMIILYSGDRRRPFFGNK